MYFSIHNNFPFKSIIKAKLLLCRADKPFVSSDNLSNKGRILSNIPNLFQFYILLLINPTQIPASTCKVRLPSRCEKGKLVFA